jgi:hypothetical protein
LEDQELDGDFREMGCEEEKRCYWFRIIPNGRLYISSTENLVTATITLDEFSFKRFLNMGLKQKGTFMAIPDLFKLYNVSVF